MNVFKLFSTVIYYKLLLHAFALSLVIYKNMYHLARTISPFGFIGVVPCLANDT